MYLLQTPVQNATLCKCVSSASPRVLIAISNIASLHQRHDRKHDKLVHANCENNHMHMLLEGSHSVDEVFVPKEKQKGFSTVWYCALRHGWEYPFFFLGNATLLNMSSYISFVWFQLGSHVRGKRKREEMQGVIAAMRKQQQAQHWKLSE